MLLQHTEEYRWNWKQILRSVNCKDLLHYNHQYLSSFKESDLKTLIYLPDDIQTQILELLGAWISRYLFQSLNPQSNQECNEDNNTLAQAYLNYLSDYLGERKRSQILRRASNHFKRNGFLYGGVELLWTYLICIGRRDIKISVHTYPTSKDQLVAYIPQLEHYQQLYIQVILENLKSALYQFLSLPNNLCLPLGLKSYTHVKQVKALSNSSEGIVDSTVSNFSFFRNNQNYQLLSQTENPLSKPKMI